MPGAVPNTSTYALTNATLPYVLQLANQGWRGALRSNEPLSRGLNTWQGHITYAAVAEGFGLDSVPLADALA